jgi:hypothetical protein
MDGDGRIDLFVGGRVIPGAYPKPENGYILRNESQGGTVRFRDVSASVAPELAGIGMIQDACWADFDKDGDPDLALTGPWMGIRLFRNTSGKLKAWDTEMDTRKGWWNALTAADLDGDGDLDVVAGNYGQNGFFRATDKTPLRVYANDYDGNGLPDLLLSQYRASEAHGPAKEYPVLLRDAMAEELPQIKKYFNSYGGYARATMPELLKPFNRQGELVLEARAFESGWWENRGKDGFLFHAFPAEAQLSSIHAILVTDLNGDAKPDIVLGGNDEGAATVPGRSDAFPGLVLLGKGGGEFVSLSILESGLYLPGDARSLVALRAGNHQAIAAGQCLGPLKLFRLRR